MMNEAGTVPAKPRRKRSDVAVPDTVEGIITRIIILQRERLFFLRLRLKLENSASAYVARQLGYRKDMPEKEGKGLWEFARKLREAAEVGQAEELIARGSNVTSADLTQVLANISRAVRLTAHSRAPIDKELDDIIYEMETLAMRLPAWPKLESIKGFGPLSLAVIVAEAGADLSAFSTREKLWKRLCVAAINGRRQGDPGDGATAQDWIDHGYSGKRRSEVWNRAGPILKAQWCGARDEDGKNPLKTKKPVAVPAHPTGHYGEVYAYRRARMHALNEAGAYAERAAEIARRLKKKGKTVPAENLAGRLTRSHMNNDALRIMTKALIEDVWRVWNGKEPRKRLLNAQDYAPVEMDEAA